VHWQLAFLTPEAAVGLVVLLVIGKNFCRPLTSAPLATVAMSTLPADQLLMGTGLLSLAQGVGGTIATAASATYIASRQDFYNTAYSQTQPMHEETTRLAQHMAGELTRSGAGTDQTALEQAWSVLRRQMTEAASLAAYQDLFRMTAILGLLVIAPVLFLKINRTVVHQQRQQSGRRRSRISFE
jgi:hypothetical protein